MFVSCLCNLLAYLMEIFQVSGRFDQFCDEVILLLFGYIVVTNQENTLYYIVIIKGYLPIH